MNIFDINAEIESLFTKAVDPDTGEILDEEAIREYENLLIAKDEKIENILLLYKNVSAEAEAIKTESEKLAKRAKIASNKEESIKKLALYALGGEAFKSPKVVAKFKKSTSVEIYDENALPLDFITTQVVSKPDKKAIGEALKNGKDILGASLIEKSNLIVS